MFAARRPKSVMPFVRVSLAHSQASEFPERSGILARNDNSHSRYLVGWGRSNCGREFDAQATVTTRMQPLERPLWRWTRVSINFELCQSPTIGLNAISTTSIISKSCRQRALRCCETMRLSGVSKPGKGV